MTIAQAVWTTIGCTLYVVFGAMWITGFIKRRPLWLKEWGPCVIPVTIIWPICASFESICSKSKDF